MRETVTAGGAVEALVERSFDDRGLLACQAQRMNKTLFGTTTGMDGTARTLASSYDPDGNRLSLTDGGGAWGYSAGFGYDGLDRFAGTLESGYQTTQVTYDAGGRRASLSSGFGTMTASTSYLYDAAGRLQTQAHDLAGADFDQSVTFGYNPASQLTSEARTNGAYAFTRAANVARTYGVNGLNQYTGAGPAGAQAPFGYDANGNLTDTPAADGGTTHYVYDAENRLVQATTGTSVVTLAYDPNGRLWQVSAPSGTTRFLYDGDRLIVESDGAGNALRSYTHGPGPDEPLVWYENGRKYLHADHQGSIVAVTDQDGNKLAINGYDAWGIPNSGNMGRFGYTGQAWLPELGMWYYKARMYSPTAGRFLQTDPIGYKDQVNLYAYVGNDPTNRNDPSGKDAIVVVQSDGSIRITVPIVFSGDAATPANVSAISQSISAAFTGNFDGTRVTTTVVPLTADEAKSSPVVNTMAITTGPATGGHNSGHSYVRGGAEAHVTMMDQNGQAIANGSSSSTGDKGASTGAHEGGHLIGLPDSNARGPGLMDRGPGTAVRGADIARAIQRNTPSGAVNAVTRCSPNQ